MAQRAKYMPVTPVTVEAQSESAETMRADLLRLGKSAGTVAKRIATRGSVCHEEARIIFDPFAWSTVKAKRASQVIRYQLLQRELAQ